MQILVLGKISKDISILGKEPTQNGVLYALATHRAAQNARQAASGRVISAGNLADIISVSALESPVFVQPTHDY